MNVTGPDGKVYAFPDDATEEEVMEFFGQSAAAPAAPLQQQQGPAAPQLDWIDRNIGVPLGIVSVDPQTGKAVPSPSPLRPIARPLAEGATLGALDEAEGLAHAVAGKMQERGIGDVIAGRPSSFSDLYAEGVDRSRAESAAVAEANPNLTTVLQIVGGLAAGGPGKTLAAPATLGQAVKSGAAIGGGYGAASGFASGEGGLQNRLTSVGIGLGTGAALGAALPLAATGLSKAYGAITGKGAKPTGPTTADLKSQSKAQYKIAEGENLTIADPATAQFAVDLANDMKKAGIDKVLHPKGTSVLTGVTENLTSGKSISLQDLDILRQRAMDAANSTDAGERRIGGMIIEKIDDFVDSLSPTDVVAGDPGKAVGAIKQARELWSRMRKSEAIEWAIEKANLRAASTGSGGNADNAIRQNLRALLTNERTRRLWTLEEKGALEFVIKGGAIQNLSRLVGKLSPEGSGLMMALGGMAAIPTGGWSAAAQAIGFAAKRYADAATPKNAQRLLELVRTGKITPSQVKMLPPQVQALIRAATQAGSVEAGNVAGSISRPAQTPVP